MKQYEVLGQHAVHGYPPGQTFSADLEPAQEKRMLDRGSLRIVPGKSLKSFSRDQLNEQAAALGVPSPDELENKQAVIDAIETAQNNDDSNGGD